jgi:Tripartite tricarboxylate transporter family receptor
MHNPVSTGKPFGPDGQPRCRPQYQCLIAFQQARGCAFILSQLATVSRVFYCRKAPMASVLFAMCPSNRLTTACILPALSYSPWGGFFAPRGTPREIIGKLNAAAVDALADPVVRSRLVDLGYEVFPRERQTPEALGELVKADAEKWWPIIKELGIKAE